MEGKLEKIPAAATCNVELNLCRAGEYPTGHTVFYFDSPVGDSITGDADT